MRGGSEAKNQELRLSIAESGNGLAPVFPFTIGAALFARDFLAVFHETRALAAGDNLFVQNAKQRGRFRHWLDWRGAASCDSDRHKEWRRQRWIRRSAFSALLSRLAARRPLQHALGRNRRSRGPRRFFPILLPGARWDLPGC